MRQRAPHYVLRRTRSWCAPLVLLAALACSTDRTTPAPATPVEPPPTAPAAPVVAALTVPAGDRQSGYPQTVLPTPLQLRATTAF